MNCASLRRFIGLYFYLDDYQPYIRTPNYMITDFDRKIMDIKDHRTTEYWLAKQEAAIAYFYNRLRPVLLDERGSGLVLSYVPRSGVDEPSHICSVAKTLCRDLNLVDGTACLKRYRAIERAHDTGNRQAGRQRSSLQIMNRSLINNKRVLLLDDVATSGTSINECGELLYEAGAKEVIKMVLGKTVEV